MAEPGRPTSGMPSSCSRCMRFACVTSAHLGRGPWQVCMTEGYVELHARSAFSFLEGASLPEALAEQAANLGMPALGLLDRDGLYSAPRLYMKAQKLGLRSHIGAEVSTEKFGSQLL